MSNFNGLIKLLVVVVIVTLFTVINTSVQSNAYSDHYSRMVIEPLLLDSENLYQWHTFWKPINLLDSYRESKVAIDSIGNIFIVTSSDSAWSGPTNSGCGSSHPYTGDLDILIVKLSPQGNYLCHKYFGGASFDLGLDIAIDPNDNVYVGGYGMDWNYNTGDAEISPRQSHDPDGPAFTIIRLDNNLGYQWHAFEGKFVNTFGGIALDSKNNIYVSGASRETNLGTNKFTIAKIKNSGEPVETDGTEMWFRSYGEDARGYDIAVNEDGVVAVGYSNSIWPIGLDNPLQGVAFQSIPIVKLDLDGNYQWHTFYGLHNEEARAVKIDDQGNVVLAGYSDGFPGDNGEDPINDSSGDTKAFVLKLNSSGRYEWHTFYGNNLTISNDLVIDQQGNIYLTGRSNASFLGEFSTSPIHPFSGHTNIFILSLWPNGHYRWHTFYGTGVGENGIYDEGFGISSHGDEIIITGVSETEWHGDKDELPSDNFGFDHGLFVLALKSSSIVPVTGRVIWDNGTPEQGVKVTAMRIASPPPDDVVASSITDDQGRYHLVVKGLFDYIKPVKDRLTFFPGRENIGDCLDCIGGNFTIPQPFLDLPLDYDNFSLEILGNTNNGPGKVNSWFDHYYPNYEYAPDGYNQVKTWVDNFIWPDDPCWNETGKGVCWYDEHDGTDFTGDYDDPVYSADTGTVVKVYNQCGEGYFLNPCGYNQNYLGNQIWIDHGNGYLTVYGHLLKDSILVSEGNWFLGRVQIAGMGNSGSSTGPHLHFAVYYDKNNNADWTHATSLDAEEVVDPYGWQPYGKDRYNEPDPWEEYSQSTSRWMWKYPAMKTNLADESGGIYSSPSGYKIISIPPGALGSEVELEIWDETPTRGLLQGYQSTGQAFWLRVPDLELMRHNAGDDFSVPITLTVKYEEMAVAHIDISKLKLLHFDESTQSWEILETNLSSDMHQAQAQSLQAGHFDLQGPRLCPLDIFEPDDTSAGATLVKTEGKVSWFDTATDEDWFRFNANSGVNYTIEVLPATPEVKPIIELYAIDGQTLLVTSTNVEGKEVLKWKAESHGIYFVRIRQAADSAYGCDAGIQANLVAEVSIWLPLVRR